MSRVEDGRFARETYLHPRRSEPGASYTFAAGSIGDVRGFDAAFFGISPREAVQLDPQQRLLLELAWEALESGGIRPSSIRGSRTSVHVGFSGSDYAYRRADDLATVDAFSMTGTTASIAANRISYFFDLRGPSFAVDTACSSSLVALHQANLALAAGESDLAIAGAVSLHLHPLPFIAFSKASMLSERGACRPFDASGDGYVRAEGGGVVLLRRLEDALAAGERVYAVVAASALNCDGKTSSLTVPSCEAQAALLREVYGRAGIDPAQIDYVEAHGTGTPVGDPIEARALGLALGRRRPAGSPLPIGSVKSNIGHLETAAGMAGLAKALYCLQHRAIPPSAHFENPNPAIDFRDLNLEVVAAERPLPASKRRLVIGINSFGFGGANAHVVLESAPRGARAAPAGPAGGVPIVVSGRSEPALKAAALRLSEWIRAREDLSLYEIAYSAAHHRDWHEHRAIVHGATRAAASEALAAFAQGADAPEVAYGRVLTHPAGPVFVYSGNGAQWPGMGRTLLAGSEAFARALQEVDRHFAPLGGFSVTEVLQAENLAQRLEATEVAQPLLFAIQVGLTELLRGWGFAPAAVVGHSVGEVAAAWACGALTLEQAVRVIHHRSAAQGRTRGTGAMSALALGDAEARALLEALGMLERVAIAAVNSPASVTVAGPAAELERLEGVLAARGVSHRRLALDYAFHSEAMDPIRERVRGALAGLRPASAQVAFRSAVTGEPLAGEALDAGYWWRNIRQPVQFGRAIAGLARSGMSLFLEIGPQPVLRGYVAECLRAAQLEGRALPTLTRAGDGLEALRAHAYEALIAGCPHDLGAFFPERARYADIPRYPWQREVHWYEPSPESVGLIQRRARHALLGYRVLPGEPQWEAQLGCERLPELADHRVGDEIVLPAAAFAEMALAAAAETHESGACEIEELEIRAPLTLERQRSKTARLALDPADGSFGIRARERLGSDAWRLHAVGRIVPAATPAGAAPVLRVPERAPDIDAEAHYGITARAGLDYGPRFRAVQQAWTEGDVVTAALAAGSESGGDAFLLRPSGLDAAFQLLAHVQGRAAAAHEGTAFVPVKIGRCALLRPGAAARYARLEVRRRGMRTVLADCGLYDERREPIAIVRDVRFRAVQLRKPALARLTWLAERAVPMPVAPPHAPAALPPTAALASACAASLHSPARLARRRRYFGDAEPLMEAMLAAFAGEPDLPEPQDIFLRLLRDYPEHAEETIALAAAARGVPVPEEAAQGFAETHDFARALARLVREALDRLPEGARLRVLVREPEGAGWASAPLAEIDPERCEVRASADDGRFDIVIASGAGLRAEAGALEALRRAARPGALLVLGEPRELLALRRGRPPPPAAWHAPLARAGFVPEGLLEDLPQAQGCAYLVLARAAPEAAAPAGEPLAKRHWIVVGDGVGGGLALAAALAAQLKSRGHAVLFAQPGSAFALVEREGCLFDPLQAPDWEALLRVARDRFSEVDGIVHLYGLGAGEAARQIDRCESLRAMLEACATLALAPACWLATARAYERGDDAPFAGFVRSAMNEYPDLALRLADLAEPEARAEMAARLADAIENPDAEDEIVLTREGRRALRVDSLAAAERSAPRCEAPRERGVARLELGAPGQLKSLAWMRRECAPPGPDEVEIEVRAAGLNFRDVMYAMGQLPDEALETGFAGPGFGMEAAGVVTAVGAGVQALAPGDEVIAFAPAAFSTRIVTRAGAVVKKPPAWSFEAAATVPTAFFTAWYALEHLARLREGERILIHGAAGGVGVAAIQIARSAGAEVFATAGSEVKREFLRLLGADRVLDSRTLAFAEDVRALTGGEGVDVVLNSLAGEAMVRSLGVLKPLGRFLELGKRDLYENTRIGLRPLRNNITYHAIDVDQLMRERPALSREVLCELMAAFESGRLAPLPCRVFPASQALEAFRYMQQSRHIGKIVLGFEPPPAGRSPAAERDGRLALRADATYLVTGGLRGFGLRTAQWLAGKGARSLVLAGRSAPDAEAAAAIATLRAQGVRVRAAACDVTDRAALAALLAGIRRELPPLRGVVHAAAVIRDGLVRGLEREAIAQVLAPKMAGAKLLDELTREDPIELFVLYSSATTLFGSPGQASYVAANRYLEILARERRAQGLPALAVAWGPIADAGYLARHEATRAALEARMGGAAIPVALALEALERMLASGAPDSAVIELGRGALPRLAAAARSPRFERLRAAAGSAAAPGPASEDVRRWVAEMDDAQLATLFTEMVKKEIGEILRMPPERLDAQRPLQDLGFDSLMGVELMSAVEARFGVNIPVMALSEIATVERLVARIVRELRRSAADAPGPEPALAEQVRLLAAQHASEIPREQVEGFAAEFKANGK